MIRRFLLLGILSGMVLLTPGCEDQNEDAGTFANVAGEWSGYYQFPGQGRVPLSASVGVNGHTLFVRTSLAGTCHLLTGRISDSGYVFLTDAYDADTWTVAEPVTEHTMYLIDYAFGAGSSLRHLTLTR